MDNDIIKQFNLPGYIKGKTFADASKAINNKFKDRTDRVSNATKEELLSRLAEAQEYIKMQESFASNMSEVPEMGDIPAEFNTGGSMEEYFNGGVIEDAEEKTSAFKDPGVGGYLDMASTALDIGNQVFGNTGIDVHGGQRYDKVNKGGAALSGALSGAKVGAAAGPAGAIIGGLVGGVGSLIGAGRKNKEIIEANTNHAIAQTADMRSDFKYGGVMKYERGGLLSDIFKLDTSKLPQPVSFNPSLSTPKDVKGKGLPRALNWLGENAGDIAQYAPIAGNLLELNNLDKPVTPRGARLEGRYTPDLFDINSTINRVNQNDISGALQEASTGNLGSLRSSLLAADLNKKRAISDAAIQGEAINKDENRFKFQSDDAINRTNLALEQDYINRREADQGAYETTRANLRRQLFEDLGDIGREEVNKKIVKDMFGYKWNGKYWVNPKDGTKYTPQEVQKQLDERNKKNKTNGEG